MAALDSALPTGAFAHSFGLEAAHQHNLMPSLSLFVGGCLMNLATSALPVVRYLVEQDNRASLSGRRRALDVFR